MSQDRPSALLDTLQGEAPPPPPPGVPSLRPTCFFRFVDQPRLFPNLLDGVCARLMDCARPGTANLLPW